MRIATKKGRAIYNDMNKEEIKHKFLMYENLIDLFFSKNWFIKSICKL